MSLIKLKSNLDKIIGIGETGLDYYYENSDKNDKDIVYEEEKILGRILEKEKY